MYLKIGIQQLLKNILRHNTYIKEAVAILLLLFIKMFNIRITKSMAPPFQYTQVEKAALILGRCGFLKISMDVRSQILCVYLEKGNNGWQ